MLSSAPSYAKTPQRSHDIERKIQEACFEFLSSDFSFTSSFARDEYLMTLMSAGAQVGSIVCGTMMNMKGECMQIGYRY